MKHEQITFKINKATGEIEIKTLGFEGNSCHTMDELERSIGTINYTENTSDAFQYIQSNGVEVKC